MSIVINDDERLEESESFTVTLEAMDALNGLVRLEQTLAIITISDDDGELRNHKLTHNCTTFLSFVLLSKCHINISAAVVGLEHVQYSVIEEDGVIEVCAVVSSPDIDCPVDFSFEVKFFTVDVTAGKY